MLYGHRGIITLYLISNFVRHRYLLGYQREQVVSIDQVKNHIDFYLSNLYLSKY